MLADGTKVTCDILVLATGSQPFYFGQDSWARVCSGLKTIEDARTIRSRLLLSFESGSLKLKGWFAWSAWAVIHVYLLVGFQHRVQVSVQ